MARQVIRYQSADGSEWQTQGEADARNALIAEVAGVMAPLGPDRHDEPGVEYANGRGFVRHDPATVTAVKQRLLGLTRRFIGEWMEMQERVHKADMAVVDPSWFCRLLDGSAPPVEKAWGRLWCIDGQGREWGQPYYSSHPDEAEAFEIPNDAKGTE